VILSGLILSNAWTALYRPGAVIVANSVFDAYALLLQNQSASMAKLRLNFALLTASVKIRGAMDEMPESVLQIISLSIAVLDIRYVTPLLQRSLGSKIEAKFRTFYPMYKIREGVGEIRLSEFYEFSLEPNLWWRSTTRSLRRLESRCQKYRSILEGFPTYVGRTHNKIQDKINGK